MVSCNIVTWACQYLSMLSHVVILNENILFEFPPPLPRSQAAADYYEAVLQPS